MVRCSTNTLEKKQGLATEDRATVYYPHAFRKNILRIITMMHLKINETLMKQTKSEVMSDLN